jgi:aspartate kinase
LLRDDLIVCKFGGSSVADAGQFRKIKKVVESDARRRLIVVSAPGKRSAEETKLTDLFYTVYHLASQSLDFSSPLKLIVERYKEISQELGLKGEFLSAFDNLKSDLKTKSEAITSDYLVSRGEYFSALMMAEYLHADFVDSASILSLGSRQTVLDSSWDLIRSNIKSENITVVPGFYGSDKNGQIKTFSRGGSDITGALLAKAFSAGKYENWTDVSGLLVTDPRIVKNPHPIKNVSYREIRELAYSGANVLHDEAIAPCQELGIPIQIKNTNRPEDEGTIIGPIPKTSPYTITGISGRKGFSLIHMEKTMMNKERGFGRKVMAILETYDLNFEHAPTGIDSMSVVVDSDSFVEAEDVVMNDLKNQMSLDAIKVESNLALIAVVGHGMVRQVGVASKLFSALAANDVNIRIIDQGSSEINIIVGVDNSNYEKSISVIYSAFVEV